MRGECLLLTQVSSLGVEVRKRDVRTHLYSLEEKTASVVYWVQIMKIPNNRYYKRAGNTFIKVGGVVYCVCNVCRKRTIRTHWKGRKYCSGKCWSKYLQDNRGAKKQRYIPGWHNVRCRALKRDNNKCQECGNKAEGVHLIKTTREYPQLLLVLDNLQSLCKPCHHKKHPHLSSFLFR